MLDRATGLLAEVNELFVEREKQLLQVLPA